MKQTGVRKCGRAGSTVLPKMGHAPEKKNGRLASASVAYRELSMGEQMAVIQDLLDTRSDELRAAYPNVIGFGIGFRKRRNRAGLSRVVNGSDAHLRFLVKRKWNERQVESTKRRGRIPKYLLASFGNLGGRTVVAVPTDVEGRPSRRHVTYQGQGIRADDGEVFVDGALACVIRETVGKVRRYLGISCRHVLSPGGDIEGEGEPASRVRNANSETRLGVATSRRGAMNDAGKLNFDAQVMLFDSPALAASAIESGVSYSGEPLATVPDLGTPMDLHLPDGSPLRVRVSAYWMHSTPVLPDLMPHRQVLEMECISGETEQGDSGSPLVIPGTQPRLAGMHIARWLNDGKALSLCIPAWDLLNKYLYGNVIEDSKWTLM